MFDDAAPPQFCEMLRSEHGNTSRKAKSKADALLTSTAHQKLRHRQVTNYLEPFVLLDLGAGVVTMV